MRLNLFSGEAGREFFTSVFLLGLISIAAQIILLREFLSFFYGNELVLGLILANWMLLTGLGAYLGKNAEKRVFSLTPAMLLLTVLAVLPFVLVFLMYYLRNVVFVQGSMLNLAEIFLSSLALLLPFCLLSGFIFTLLAELTSRYHQKNLIEKVYAWESFGSLAGGIVFNLVIIWFLKTFQSLTLLALFNLMMISWLAWRHHMRRLVWFTGAFFIGMVLLNIFVNPDLLARRYLYAGHDVEYFKSSPYGNIVVTRQGEQINFYENQLLLFSSQQPTLSEESVHYPMLQHDQPGQVLLLSGGTPGMIREILKYDIHHLDYVEINPWLIQAVRKYSQVYKNPRVGVINQDARLYVKNTDKQYDAALINLPEPSTVQLNRYYTESFYKELKKCLNPGAVVSFSISGSSNYMSEEARQLNSSLYQTLRTAFSHVMLIPGEKIYFVASDQPLTYEISKLAEKKGLDNVYVNPYYIQDDLLKRRGKLLMDELIAGAEVNTDFKPITYYLKVQQWLSYFDFNYWMPLVLAAFVALYFFIRLHPVNMGMFAAGFAGASVEVILLVAFQILYGYVYSMVGIIVTVFMAGLAVGTFYRGKLIPRVHVSVYYRLIWFMGGYILLLPLILYGLRHISLPPWVIHIVFVMLMFLTAMFVGMIFSVASQLRLKKWITIVSEVYSVDLLGAGIGTFVVSVYLIPVWGLMNVLLITAGISLLSGVLVLVRLGKK